MSPEHNPKVKPEQLDSSRLDEKNLVTPAPKHQDDFHEKFDNITEGYDSRTGTVPPNERDDRHLKTDDEPEHTGLSAFQKIGLGAAGLAAVVGAAVGGKAAFGGNNEAPTPQQPVASAPVTPGETQAPAEVITPISDITDAEILHLNEICSSATLTGFGDEPMAFKSRLDKLSQKDVNYLRTIMQKIETLPDGDEKNHFCMSIVLAIDNALGL